MARPLSEAQALTNCYATPTPQHTSEKRPVFTPQACAALVACLSVQDAAGAYEALFSVLRNVTKQEVVQYTLALLDHITFMEPSSVASLHGTSSSGSAPNAPLVLSRLLSRPDQFTQARAARLLASALRTAPQPDDKIVASFMEWITGQLRAEQAAPEILEVATGALAVLLRDRAARTNFAHNVPLLVRLPSILDQRGLCGKCHVPLHADECVLFLCHRLGAYVWAYML